MFRKSIIFTSSKNRLTGIAFGGLHPRGRVRSALHIHPRLDVLPAQRKKFHSLTVVPGSSQARGQMLVADGPSPHAPECRTDQANHSLPGCLSHWRVGHVLVEAHAAGRLDGEYDVNHLCVSRRQHRTCAAAWFETRSISGQCGWQLLMRSARCSPSSDPVEATNLGKLHALCFDTGKARRCGV